MLVAWRSSVSSVVAYICFFFAVSIFYVVWHLGADAGQDISTNTASVPKTNGRHERHRIIFSFGDSYTRTGFQWNGTLPSSDNPFGNPPYPGDTFGGIKNWIGDLVHDMAPNGTLSYNFAIGGSVISTSLAQVKGNREFQVQVGHYIACGAPTSAEWNATTAAFVTWFGANDLQFTHKGSWNYQETFNRMMESYYGKITQLYDSGGRIFVIIAGPPIHRTPRFLNMADGARMEKQVQLFNDKMQTYAIGWREEHQDAQLAIVNVAPSWNEILDDPQRFGAPDATCYEDNEKKCLWVNEFHPSYQLEKAVAEVVYAKLKELGFWS